MYNCSTDGDSSAYDCSTDDESATLQEPVLHHKRRKLRTTNSRVNSLAASLDSANYNEVQPPDQEEVHTSILAKGTRRALPVTIKWTNQRPNVAGRQGAENIIITPGGLINNSHNATAPSQALGLFLDADMFNHIVSCTNIQINKIISEIDPEKFKSYSNIAFETTVNEIRAFVGLMYARGLFHLNHQDSRILFRSSIGHPVFGAVMSCNRFRFLTSHIRFDDVRSRQGRFVSDRFAACRELFEKFNNRCNKALQPDEYLAIDETLYGCRNQISFKQYNKSKPQKYGLLFKSINSVSYPFTFQTVVYSAKPISGSGEFHISGIIPIVKSLIERLGANVDLRGRNITMDRLYTSYELFE